MVRLHDVTEWSEDMTCVPTALCGVTGLSRAAVETAIKRAVKDKDGIELKDFSSVNIKHWLPALKILGVAHEYVQDLYIVEPAVDTFMYSHNFHEVILVDALNRGLKANGGHVFAAQRRNVVDSNTMGRIKPFGLDERRILQGFRVQKVFLLKKLRD
jgi:hypothetical protein